MNNIFQVVLNRIKKKDNVSVARDMGVKIGKDCLILSNPYRCFGSEPYLVELGDHVEITGGCQFVTHDGGVWTIRVQEGCEKVDKFGKITVGDNVFIGINSIILPGVKIGNNCVIGAGAVVTKNIPSGEVWGGVPAKFISTYEQYMKKSIKEADFTKGLIPEEKKKAIQEKHPEWF
ncbi:acyltransferase [Lactonifactor longoviformis]|uniref:acyltransferase n=1 Tax=Lactonifactor longoviformis TaxID=341220 RepID=UPI0036F1D190